MAITHDIPPKPHSPEVFLEAVRAHVKGALEGHPQAVTTLLDALGGLAVDLAAAAAILALTLWGSRWGSNATRRALERLSGPAGADATLHGFLASVIRWAILLVGLMAVLELLGVQTASVLALLGAGSLAIGLAIQGALSNVAAGVMLLVLRPYRVGDFVEINGKSGTVKRLDLFMTALSDADNLDIFMPNGKVFGEMIVNYTTPGRRRMVIELSVDFDVDHALALRTLLACATADPRVLADPPPWAGVTAVTERGWTVTLRAWAPTGVFWDVKFDLLARVKTAFSEAGLSASAPLLIQVAEGPRGPRAARANPDAG